jgi:Thioesterase-like superfamily
VTPAAFYVAADADAAGVGRFEPTRHTNGPWSEGLQHGGPPAALLARAMERLPGAAERLVARVTVDLWGPVPVAPLTVSARVERPGRAVDLVSAELRAAERPDRVLVRATAWRFAFGATDAWTPPEGVPDGPEHGHEQPRPPSWHGGYLDAVEWRWLRGSIGTPGPATVWMRPRVALVEGEDTSPLQRLLTCADSASGASAALDPAEWNFLNTELSVHLVRPTDGDWLCVDAQTTLARTSAGLATSQLFDAHGPVGRSAQSLVVSRRG